MANMKTISKQEKFKNSISPYSHLANRNEDNYRSYVLIGNWFNNRHGATQQNTKCIVPCLQPEECVKTNSVYAESYQQRVPSQAQRVTDFINWKQKSFHNLIKDLQSSVRFVDSQEFMHNMATTKDIHYDLQPRVERLHETKRNKLKAAEQDILGSYGNYTSFGLRAWKRCNELSTKCRPADRSTYSDTYGGRK